MSQRRLDLHTSTNFSIYIFSPNLYLNSFPCVKQNKWLKKLLSIDPNVKGAISESFDKSHLSESFDVPAGCILFCSQTH